MIDLITALLAEVPLNRSDVLTIIATASRRYKVYEIPKKNGKGSRTIAQPAPEVKLLQRAVVNNLIRDWPVHSAATAYIRHSSIRNHAELHANSKFLLKLDFQNFFPSIKSNDIKQHAQRYSSLATTDIALLVRILSWRNKANGEHCLSIGAPSSPFVSNSMLFEFDSRVSDLCKSLGVTYSRYADDLAFSTSQPSVLDDLTLQLPAILNKISYPRLVFNDQKTVNVSRRFNRTLVGLTLSAQGAVSLGRDRKRNIRAQVHSFCNGLLNDHQIDHLNGMLAFAWSIEPHFVSSTLSRYSAEQKARLKLPSAALG